MGAWGYGPVQGDAAYDWFVSAMGPVVKSIDKALSLPISGRAKYRNAELIRAAALLLERVGYQGIYPSTAHLILAIGKLGAIADDEDMAANWNDPKAYTKAVRAQIRALERRVEDPTLPGNKGLFDTIGVARRSSRSSSASA